MRRLTLIAGLCAAVLLGAGAAHGEIFGNGSLLVSFGGRFLPHSLPRDRDVPISVRLEGSIKTDDGSPPPQLRSISIEVNRYGLLSTEGLPICHPDLLESTDSQAALERCGPALVGHGHFGATVAFPNVAPFPVEGKMLAFNSKVHGRPAILLHIHGSDPVEATVVLTFKIQHRQTGKFGTVLSAKIPRIASDLGYVTDLSLFFNRRYRYHGAPRSFLSARCAAPAGFPGALFTFARGVFDFAGGKRLTTTLARDCQVRRS